MGPFRGGVQPKGMSRRRVQPRAEVQAGDGPSQKRVQSGDGSSQSVGTARRVTKPQKFRLSKMSIGGVWESGSTMSPPLGFLSSEMMSSPCGQQAEIAPHVGNLSPCVVSWLRDTSETNTDKHRANFSTIKTTCLISLRHDVETRATLQEGAFCQPKGAIVTKLSTLLRLRFNFCTFVLFYNARASRTHGSCSALRDFVPSSVILRTLKSEAGEILPPIDESDFSQRLNRHYAE